MDHQPRRATELAQPETVPSNRTSAAETFRFLIVDDHALVRFGFLLTLKQRYADATIVEANSLADALRALQTYPDLTAILYDLQLDDSDQLEGLAVMLEAAGDVPVIVVSGTGDSATIASCIRAGARAFVHKACEAATLDQALPIVLSGGIIAPALPARHGGNPIRIPLSSTAPPPRSADVVNTLTDRQRQVLLLLLEGQSNKEIARALGVLEGTIKVHLRTVMQRLGVRNRTQLALAAVKAGIAPSAENTHKRMSQ